MMRLLDAVGRTLEPWSQFLASRFPIVWRTRSAEYLAVLLITHASCWIVASFWPLSTRTIPSIDRLHGSTVMLQWMIGLALLVWLVSKNQLELGPRLWRHRLVARLFDAVVCFVALAGPLLVAERFIDRIADLVPDEELTAEMELHGSYGFWRCDERIDDAAFALHVDAIRAAVVKYHHAEGAPPLRLDAADRPDSIFTLPPTGCAASDRYAVFENALSGISETWFLVELRSPLESLAAAKALRRAEGVHAVWLGGNLVHVLWISLLLGSSTLVDSRLRRLQFRWPRFSFTWPRPPERLARVDRWLVTRAPVAWSTGLHRFLATIALVSLGVAVPATCIARLNGSTTFWRWWIDARENDGAWQLLFLLGAPMAAAWLLYRRAWPHRSRSVRDEVLIVALGMAAITSASPIVMLVLLLVDPWAWREAVPTVLIDSGGIDFAVVFGSLVGALVAVFLFLTRWLGTGAANTVVIGSVVSLIVPISLLVRLGGEAEIAEWILDASVLACALVFALTYRIRSPGRATLTLRSVALLTGLPGFMLYLISLAPDPPGIDLAVKVTIVVWTLPLWMTVLLSRPLRRWHDEPKP